MKYWEIIADNLSKAGWSWLPLSRWFRMGEESGLQTHIVTTESVWLCVRMKNWLRFWNSNRQFMRQNAQRIAEGMK